LRALGVSDARQAPQHDTFGSEMSLWTPSGEHPVDRDRSSGQPSRPGSPGAPGPGGEPGPGPGDPGGITEADLANLSPEEREQLEAMSRQVEDARRQLLQAPAGPVVGQQSLQFYELAALHLSQPEPKLDEARVAIDALNAVVEALGPRLGEAETPLRQAVHQLQMAFVEASRAAGQPAPGPGGGSPAGSEG
jgi:hypothetical protein